MVVYSSGAKGGVPVAEPDHILQASPEKLPRVTLSKRDRPWLIRIDNLDLEVVVECDVEEPRVPPEVVSSEGPVG